MGHGKRKILKAISSYYLIALLGSNPDSLTIQLDQFFLRFVDWKWKHSSSHGKVETSLTIEKN
jgi:hypothetical protein